MGRSGFLPTPSFLRIDHKGNVIIALRHRTYRYLPAFQALMLLAAVVFVVMQPFAGRMNFETGTDMRGCRIAVPTETPNLVIEPPSTDIESICDLAVVDVLPVAPVTPCVLYVSESDPQCTTLPLKIISSFHCSSDL
jgi:hypothetical protein